MFFLLAKVIWAVIQPLSLALLLILTGLGSLAAGWRRLAATASATAFVIVFVSAFTSAGALLLKPLEDRFSRPDPDPQQVDGIIVLGGGFEGGINLARGGYELNSGGDRFVETAILARRFPAARIVISGGSGSLALSGEADADTAPRLLTALGVDPDRLVLENKSRDTYENAGMTRELVEPEPGDTWLLVTSAFHMPRSVALFRKAGFEVTPWPTDYRTRGTETLEVFSDNPVDSIQAVTIGMREWVGLTAYWLQGRIDEIFPAPRSGQQKQQYDNRDRNSDDPEE